VRAYNIEDNSISYSWDTIPGSRGYAIKIYKSPGDSTTGPIIDTVVTNPPFMATGLEPNTAYTFEIQNICEDEGGRTFRSCSMLFLTSTTDFIIVEVVERQTPENAANCATMNNCNAPVQTLEASGCFAWQSSGSEWHHIEVYNTTLPTRLCRIRVYKEVITDGDDVVIRVTSYDLTDCDCSPEDNGKYCVENAPELGCSTPPCTSLVSHSSIAPAFEISFSQAGYCLNFNGGAGFTVPATPANLAAINRSVRIFVCPF